MGTVLPPISVHRTAVTGPLQAVIAQWPVAAQQRLLSVAVTR